MLLTGGSAGWVFDATYFEKNYQTAILAESVVLNSPFINHDGIDGTAVGVSGADVISSPVPTGKAGETFDENVCASYNLLYEYDISEIVFCFTYASPNLKITGEKSVSVM